MAKKGKRNRAKRAEKPRAVAGNGKATLIFPPSPGTAEGFTASSQASFSADPSSCVRELVQNALDAALVSAKVECAVVRFSLERCKIADIPGMAEYKTALASAMNENLNDLSRSIAGSLRRNSEKDAVTALFISDNGVGFDQRRLGAMLGDGVSQQSGEESRGAFGNGHLTAFALSKLRYAFYGGVQQDGKMLFSGHAVLSSHTGKYDGKTRALSKDGYYVRRIREDKLNFDRFDFPGNNEIPQLLKPKMDAIKEEWSHGSVIAVCAFNNFGGSRDIEDIIARETALNFYVAVREGKLQVEINNGDKKRVLKQNDLSRILEKSKDKMRGRNGFPSGRRVWHSYHTLVNGEQHDIKTAHGSVRLLLRQGGDGKRVAICRNGMWITGDAPGLWQADFGDRKPFDALLLVDAETSGKAHTLIKLAETPLHNKIEVVRLRDKEDRKALRELLKELRDKIKGLAEEKDDETFSPADFMPIEFAAESSRGERPKASGRVERIGGGGRQNGGGKNKSKTKNTGERVLRSGKSVGAKISSRRVKEGTLKAVFVADDNCDDVEMRLSVDGGEDITCAGRETRTVAIAAVRINGGEVPSDKYMKNDNGDIVSVRLGEWKSGERYGMEADYKPPANGGKYALVIDLFRRKPREDGANTGDKNAGD